MPRVSSKRQITLPATLCEDLGIKAGDEVEILVDGNQFNVFKKVSINQLEGIVPKTHKTVSIEDMDETIKRRGSKIPTDWDTWFDEPSAPDDFERS